MVLCIQLSDKYQEFVTDPEREDFIDKLQQVEDWLYEDGEDETKGVYIAKLEELKKVKTQLLCKLFVFCVFPALFSCPKKGWFATLWVVCLMMLKIAAR